MLDSHYHVLSTIFNGLVCCKALAFLRFLVAFFAAMVFLLSFASGVHMLAL